MGCGFFFIPNLGWMGPPRARSLACLLFLVLISIACFLASYQRVEPIRRRPTRNDPRRAEGAVAAAASIDPPSRIINLSCAKAGPHWRADLPTTTSPAVELLPEVDARPLAPVRVGALRDECAVNRVDFPVAVDERVLFAHKGEWVGLEARLREVLRRWAEPIRVLPRTPRSHKQARKTSMHGSGGPTDSYGLP